MLWNTKVRSTRLKLVKEKPVPKIRIPSAVRYSYVPNRKRGSEKKLARLRERAAELILVLLFKA